MGVFFFIWGDLSLGNEKINHRSYRCIAAGSLEEENKELSETGLDHSFLRILECLK
jgi:hypothetical protein